MSEAGLDEADMAFMNSLTTEQRQALERLVGHVITMCQAASKGLAPAQLLHPEGKCRCGLPIAEREDGNWVHVGPAGQTDRGCRAALFWVDKEAWLASSSKGYARPS
jgi:hypothetical protein